ncbi:hypothetical protein [Streptomyces barkulensis]|uniref:hypothetical protein n=1 Tax=Streptomyces barkulensis TaxID=1257026 RepID=UPI000C6D6350|nr:hypothetical protein [Streptomyces barkulensis]
MRTPRENKAAGRSTCPRCGRKRTDFGCRTVRIGEYCMQAGLYEYAEGYLVYPTYDPPGPAEGAAMVEHAPAVAEAEKAVDAALAEFTAAQSAHFDALLAADQAGVRTSSMVMRQDGAVPVRQRVSAREKARIADAEEAARDRLGDAEEALKRARDRLSRLEHRREAAVRAGRNEDREAG